MESLRRQKSDSHLGATVIETFAQHHVIDRSQWFFFCLRCKHGGHACCIDDWFNSPSFASLKLNEKIVGSHDDMKYLNRRACGVNGCLCDCSLYGE